jgi:hypothetical protein
MTGKVDELAGLGKEALKDTKGRLTKTANAAIHAFER